MSLLDAELVSKDSPRWIGFLHFLKSIIFSFFFGMTLSLFSLMLDLDIFGFYFSTFWQGVSLFFFSTLLGTGLSALTTDARSSDPEKVLKFSTHWFIALQALILLALIKGDPTPHYGMTSQEEFYEQIPLSIMTTIEFYIISRILLKNRNKENLEEKNKI